MTVSLANLHLILPDLTHEKRGLFEGTNTGKTYLPLLQTQLAEIEGLPAAIKPGTPLAQELDEADVEHDGYGGAIWHLTEAYERCPATSDEMRAAAKRIRTQFIPTLKELQGSFADEATRARKRQAALDEHKADLKLFPVADGSGNTKKTLHDWVKGYLDAGVKLGELLADRAGVPLDSRKGAAALRTKTLGILSRMRGALADEVAANPKLPRDLETQVFAYFDHLAAQWLSAKKRAKPAAAPKDEPEPQPPKG